MWTSVRRGMQRHACQVWWHFRCMGFQNEQRSQSSNSPDPFVCASYFYSRAAMHSTINKRGIRSDSCIQLYTQKHAFVTGSSFYSTAADPSFINESAPPGPFLFLIYFNDLQDFFSSPCLFFSESGCTSCQAVGVRAVPSPESRKVHPRVIRRGRSERLYRARKQGRRNLSERAQRATTKMVGGFKFVDYETRLAVLGVFHLEYRRLRGDLMLTYSLFEKSVANSFFTVDLTNTQRGHDKNLFKLRLFPLIFTTVACKVMERILKRAILDHLTSNNLISQAQHGFLPNRSCVTNMLVFMDSLTQAKDEGLISDAIFFAWPTGFSPLTEQTHGGDMLRRFLSSEGTPSLGKLFSHFVQNTIRHLFTRVLALANILPRAENLKSSATPFFHLCLSGERQLLNDKNKTDPGNLGKSLAPVYQSVNPLGQPGIILALVLPSGGMAVRHRKGATAERRKPVTELSTSFNRINGETVFWLEREFADRKVRGSNPTSASRLPLSRFGQPGSISALVQPSGGMTVRHRRGATGERFLLCQRGNLAVSQPSCFLRLKWVLGTEALVQTIRIEFDNKNAIDIGYQPYLAASPARHTRRHANPILGDEVHRRYRKFSYSLSHPSAEPKADHPTACATLNWARKTMVRYTQYTT
ncbi:hypothetical protein CSKR_114032 [Clonorchis sinensis]|uniref:Reverse transcriptase domain-containing protein n=1 Tax=Clonorchis sinensis TaxID=79923 RepID=A0A419Q496_CLOSI|nr:hypothetical protein CSKR_114032 [Clonorchis sinensis]